jgi:hypothetical protein
MSLMHRYKDKKKETLPRLGKCETLHKYHGNYIFIMIFNRYKDKEKETLPNVKPYINTMAITFLSRFLTKSEVYQLGIKLIAKQ